MNLFIPIQLVLSLILLGNVAYLEKDHSILYEREVPPYAKWGQIAMSKTKERYPEAQIIDYLHIGKVTEPTYSIEKFKLWLRRDNHEFGVFVNIRFDNKTEQMIDISFQETPR